MNQDNQNQKEKEVKTALGIAGCLGAPCLIVILGCLLVFILIIVLGALKMASGG